MKYLGKNSTQFEGLQILFKAKSDELEESPPKELRLVNFGNKIDLVVYNNTNPTQFAFAEIAEIEPGTTFYRKINPEKN